MTVLREHFPERLVSIRGDLEWPAHSPDLTTCDFFLWVYLKSRVYLNLPRTPQDLKTNIQEEIANIAPAMPAGVMTNGRNRLLSVWRMGDVTYLRRFLNEFLGKHMVSQGRIFRVSYRDLCYSVLPCSDRDTTVVLPSLTPEKLGLPGSQLPRSRSVMTSRCKQWFSQRTFTYRTTT